MKGTVVTLSSLLAASVLGNVYLLDGGKYEKVDKIVEDTQKADDLILALTPACAAKLDRPAPKCEKIKATVSVAAGPTDVWACDGGVMPASMQKCFDDAQLIAPRVKP